MDIERKFGFAPIFDKDSKLLILGSFPSVKSREIDFYYGNKQNKFWKTICGYFEEEIPESVEGKKAFLKRRKIALWDMVESCEIQGSQDITVKKEEIVDLQQVLCHANIECILLNGKLAFSLFLREYKDLCVTYKYMPSTSPANPYFDESVWKEALDDVFKTH